MHFAGGSLGKPPPAPEPHRGSRAAARTMSMRLLISMVNRSRRELNYRAGIVPSGFGCQQQPWRGRAAPQDRRSSTEPAASAASAWATCRACGQRDPGWGSATSCRALAHKRENPKQGRLQVLHAKKLLSPAAACTDLSGEATAAHL